MLPQIKNTGNEYIGDTLKSPSKELQPIPNCFSSTGVYPIKAKYKENTNVESIAVTVFL